MAILMSRGSGVMPVSSCFFCDGYTDYHPECDRPGCTNKTHGTGPEGKITTSYCEDCSGGSHA